MPAITASRRSWHPRDLDANRAGDVLTEAAPADDGDHATAAVFVGDLAGEGECVAGVEGTPSRIEIARNTACGPAQPDTKRSTSPVVVRMLRKMSLLPPATARSRSWCTSWKSRVAMADATTNVGVTSITSSGRPGHFDGGRPPGGQGQLVVDPYVVNLDRQADPDPIRADAEQLAGHPDALGELDERDDERRWLARHRRMMVHDVAVHLADAVGHNVRPPTASPQAGHIGPGGCRSAAHASQCWMRSSPPAVPAQKNSVSGDDLRPHRDRGRARVGHCGSAIDPPGANQRNRHRARVLGGT